MRLDRSWSWTKTRVCAYSSARCCEDAGFRVAQAESGENALALASDVSPRLALVDVFLPGLSGYEVCHRLKTEFHVPVVLVSRPARESLDQLAGMLLGADACVAKPFMPDDLLDRVRQLLVSQVEAA